MRHELYKAIGKEASKREDWLRWNKRKGKKRRLKKAWHRRRGYTRGYVDGLRHAMAIIRCLPLAGE